jgi:DNA-binding FadR family transcriptional regulator
MRGLHGQVVEQLGRQIVSGGFVEEHVFDTGELERELGVSRTVVREALRVLGAKGLVDARPKVGTYVRRRTEWQLFDADVLRWAFADPGTSLFSDLAVVRRIVEPAIAALAAEHRDEEDLERLAQALELMRAAGTDAAAATTADLAFHRALAMATHNELLPTLEEVIMIGLRARDLVVHTAAPGDHAISLHAAVLEAVRAQERAVAERTMLELLDTAARDSEAYAGISQG